MFTHQLTQDLRETMTKSYRLLGADGRFYSSTSKGLLGGNNRGKIYGRLDCPSALRAVQRVQLGHGHQAGLRLVQSISRGPSEMEEVDVVSLVQKS